MYHGHAVPEAALATLAKQARLEAGITHAQAARELGVSKASVSFAESEKRSLTKLRKRMIARYSGGFEIAGPFYVVKRKTDKLTDMYF